MGIGGTAKKLQKVAEMGEELYKRINDLREQVNEMRETVTATHDRVEVLESEVAEQRAILEALARTEGIDLDAVVAEAHITEAERSNGEGDGSAGGDASADAEDSVTGTTANGPGDSTSRD
ncbi:DUF5798 family protein [Salinigranum sp. GCM10025319]|uniref:DUF5798 family protein n=1 Tax=Salinigranum sp. GCM10025319 TaxID=3252687 RepID=UPI0036179494